MNPGHTTAHIKTNPDVGHMVSVTAYDSRMFNCTDPDTAHALSLALWDKGLRSYHLGREQPGTLLVLDATDLDQLADAVRPHVNQTIKHRT